MVEKEKFVLKKSLQSYFNNEWIKIKTKRMVVRRPSKKKKHIKNKNQNNFKKNEWMKIITKKWW